MENKQSTALRVALETLDPVTDERGAPRRRLNFATDGALADGRATAVLVHNASTTGLLIESAEPLDHGESIEVNLPHAGQVLASVVWRSGAFYGCSFDKPISAAALSATQLRGDPPEAGAIPPERMRESFPARLQRLRHDKRMTLADVANALGLSKPTVWAWEKGKARPADYRLPGIAELYGIDLDELLVASSGGGLDSVLETTRRQVAAEFGIAPSKVRITIDL